MNTSIKVIGVIIIIALVIFAIDTKFTNDKKKETVKIRVKNATNKDIKQIWLGASGYTKSSPLENIAVGATSDYEGFEEALPNYRQANLVMQDDTRYFGVVEPEKFFSDENLAPGMYTFTVRLVDQKAEIDIVKD